MAPRFARRADEFAALVEGLSTDGRDRFASLLDVVGQLQAVPARVPRPEFVAELRARLLAEAETVLLPVERADPDAARLTLRHPGPRTTHERRLALGVGSLALATSLASVVIGSQVALPGDSLYPVKRAVEDARTTLAVGDAETGGIVLGHATERLEETSGLTRRSEVDAAATETSLRDFTSQAEQGAELMSDAYVADRDEQTITHLREFTTSSLDRLEALEPGLPPAARDELVAAAEAVVGIDDDARATCPACGPDGPLELPFNLASSSLPGMSDLRASLAPAGRNGRTDVDTGSDRDPVPGLSVPSLVPSARPTGLPTLLPTLPTGQPTGTAAPTKVPVPSLPTGAPTVLPTALSTLLPTLPTFLPSLPTLLPTSLLTPLDPLTSILPLDPITSLLPLPLPAHGRLGEATGTLP